MPDPEQLPRQLYAIYDLLGILDPNKIEDQREKIVTWLYRILDILDSKTSHLLRLNSIILAALAFLLGGILKEQSALWWQKLVSVIPLLIPLMATIYAMLVFKVEWPFLHWRKECARIASEEVQPAMQQEFAALAKVCDRRVKQHLRVWRWTLASVIAAALSVIGSAFFWILIK
jgi:hypothetical protein